jgi:hypothetical protein
MVSMSTTSADMSSKQSSERRDMLVISSDPGDNEAMAAAGILVSRTREKILESVPGGIYTMADQADLDRQELVDIVCGARAVIVILTQGSLMSEQQLQTIVDAMGFCDSSSLIPVNAPHFKFPSQAYHAEYLVHRFPKSTADDIWSRVQQLFKIISVALATSASLQIIDTQAKEVLARIPKTKRSSARPSSVQGLDLASLFFEVGRSKPEQDEINGLKTDGTWV